LKKIRERQSCPRKAKELEELKKSAGLESDNVMASVKRSLAEVEKEKLEADMKWDEIQKQEKVRRRRNLSKLAKIFLDLSFFTCFT
jgi:Tfp pilus assembly PilM family ATPase